MTTDERTAPVQGYCRIPWSVHVKAWEGYSKEYPGSARQQDATRIAERGGFGVKELDSFHPTWRKEVEQIPKLLAEVEQLEKDVERRFVDGLGYAIEIVRKSSPGSCCEIIAALRKAIEKERSGA